MSKFIKVFSCFVLIIILYTNVVYANFGFYNLKDFYVLIDHVNEDIDKVEFVNFSACRASELFDYTIGKAYAVGFSEKSLNSCYLTREEAENVLNNPKYEDEKIYEREVRLYDINDNYDKSTYHIEYYNNSRVDPIYEMTQLGGTKYLNVDKNQNCFYICKINNRMDISNFKLQNHQIRFKINDFDGTGNIALVLYSKNNVKKFIDLNTNGKYISFESHNMTPYTMLINSGDNLLFEGKGSAYYEYDYQTDEIKCSGENNAILVLIYKILLCFFITIVIELFIAYKMGIEDYSTVFKINIITQTLLHLVYTLPAYFLDFSLASIPAGIFNFEMTSDVRKKSLDLSFWIGFSILELLIVAIEGDYYKKKSNPKIDKPYKFAFIANLATYVLSVIIHFVIN